MNNRFYKSRVKVSALILICTLIGLIGVWIIFFISKVTFFSTKIAILASIVFVFSIIYTKSIKMYKHSLEISKSKLIFRDKKTIEINIENVTDVSYHGTKFVPMSEMISIHSGLKTIYIDFNFKNYRTIWKEVVKRCEEVENIQIDRRIYKRLP